MGNFDFPWQLSSISESKDGDSIEWRSDINIFLCPRGPLVNTVRRHKHTDSIQYTVCTNFYANSRDDHFSHRMFSLLSLF